MRSREPRGRSAALPVLDELQDFIRRGQAAQRAVNEVAAAANPQAHSCPSCGAKPGDPCIAKQTREPYRGGAFHAPRIKAATGGIQ